MTKRHKDRERDHMIIGVDLDDTWFGWSHRVDMLLDEKYAHLPNIPRSKDRVAFDLWTGRTDEEKAAILEIMDSEGFYASLEPLPGAVDAYHEMIEAGHEVVPLSSPWYTNPTCMDDKGRSVLKYFGAEALNNMVLTKKKYRVLVDVLIDDKDGIEKADEAPWAQVIFDGPHNRYSTLPRLTDWKNWDSVTKKAILLKAGALSGNGTLASRQTQRAAV